MGNYVFVCYFKSYFIIIITTLKNYKVNIYI